MATVVIYNGVILRNIVTRQWQQDVVYDASNTDQICSRFHLQFDGIIHAQNVTTSPAGIETTGYKNSVESIYEFVRTRLSQSRADLLIYTVDSAGNESVLLHAIPTTNGVISSNLDVENGPKPQRVSVTNIAGCKLLRVSFSIDCALYQGKVANPTSDVPQVINNRWSIKESQSDKFFITRTIHGTIRVCSPAITPDMVSALIVPQLETGFKRERIDFTATTNGLEIEYEITDKQVHTSAPWPATKIDVVHSESTNDGLTILSSVRVRLEGHPGADKAWLFAIACSIVENYLGKIDEKKEGLFIESASFVDYIGEENIVEVVIVLRTTISYFGPGVATEVMTNIGLGKLGKPLRIEILPGYDSTVSTTPIPGGYVTGISQTARPAAWAFLKCYLQSPFVPVHGIGSPMPYSVVLPNENSESSGNLPVINGSESEVIPPQRTPSDNQSGSQKQYPYNYARASITYNNNNMRVQLPIAAVSENSTGDTSVVVSLAGKQGRMEIDYDVERAGSLPEIPEPKDVFGDDEAKIKGTLLTWWIRPQPPVIDAGKRLPIYRFACHYVYALNRQPNKHDSLHIGQLPFVVAGNETIVDKITLNAMIPTNRELMV